MDEYTIEGIATFIDYKNKGEFKLKIDDNIIYDCKYDKYLPIEYGDKIIGKCIVSNKKIVFIELPIVIFQNDYNYIIKFMTKNLKPHDIEEEKINYMCEFFNINNNIDNYLNNLCIEYFKNNNYKIVEEIAEILEIKTEILIEIIGIWFKKRIIRKLYCLGLTSIEIEKSNISELELFDICKENPYKIYSLSEDKINNLHKIFNINKDSLNLMCYKVVSKIFEIREKKAWTCVPIFYIKKLFSNIHQLKNYLITNYNVIFDDTNIYLKYCYLVENKVSKFIWNKINEENNNIINDETFISENYRCKTLTEEQKNTIKEVFNNNISIITGGPGCGKCLDPETEILLHNGNIEKIKNIKTGDIIMGDESDKRKVLSICKGTDIMYEIIPEMGYSFKCNGPHILTLKGMKPKIYNTSNYYEIVYTKKGIKKYIKYKNYNDLLKFYKSLKEDIYDISVNEYLKGNNIGFIYHQQIEYEDKYLTVDPYEYGSSLDGDKKINILYKINSYKKRLFLLSSILDKFGTITNNITKISDCSNIFLKDVEYIALSIGFFSYIKNNVLYITGNLSALPSKKKFPDNEIENIKFTINNIGVGNYFGFELDGNGRFLLSDFKVTHNTTIIGEILNILELHKLKYVCSSFTGKAVVRLEEVIGKKGFSYTIDKLIKIKNIEFDYLILDETSMITTELFYRFIECYKNNKYKIIIVGDINQLQPINWGSLMKQLIETNIIKTFVLSYNHRLKDKQNRTILTNSNLIINKSRDLAYPINFKIDKSFNIFDGNISTIEHIIASLYKFEVDYKKITILCPFNQYLDSLNNIFQTIYLFNNKTIYDSYSNKNWYIGDRIMMLVNNYDIDVMNGEEGYVVDLSNLGITVNFKGKTHLFKFTNKPKTLNSEESETKELTTNNITHSFAITVHKSQGSENDYIIFYLPSKSDANLLYTGITRTSKIIWLISSLDILNQTCSHFQPTRKENLANKILELSGVLAHECDDCDECDEEDLSVYDNI